jgi:hypothetical protein
MICGYVLLLIILNTLAAGMFAPWYMRPLAWLEWLLELGITFAVLCGSATGDLYDTISWVLNIVIDRFGVPFLESIRSLFLVLFFWLWIPYDFFIALGERLTMAEYRKYVSPAGAFSACLILAIGLVTLPTWRWLKGNLTSRWRRENKR